ncbi:MAG: type I methionyl aminopeptidase [Oscillospiraceae bacterium]|jgi:methionyl aminopeptidase|nr:type I methionyl aminopeptidase [Oscillospiraceae bacterium]
MINLKTKEEIEIMKEAGYISALALKAAGDAMKPGITTKYLDRVARDCIESNGAKPSFLGVGGFPACTCISVNNEIIHGIPSKSRVIEEGDVVTIDVGAYFKGFHGDNAKTFACGEVPMETRRLLEITEKALQIGIDTAKIGMRIGDIGSAIQKFVESNGFSVVREYCGHGIGRSIHEDPSVPNFGESGKGVLIEDGMVIAIEPMVNVGRPNVVKLKDGWSVVTADGELSAHFEHTVAVTEKGVIVLTDLGL